MANSFKPHQLDQFEDEYNDPDYCKNCGCSEWGFNDEGLIVCAECETPPISSYNPRNKSKPKLKKFKDNE